MAFDPLKINIVISSFKIISLIVGCLILFSSWLLQTKYEASFLLVYIFFVVGLILIIFSTWAIVNTLTKWG
jgi:hypothetical protein